MFKETHANGTVHWEVLMPAIQKGEGMLKFICGCDIPDQIADLKYDSEGFFVCPTHNARRYGWRSRERRHRHECDWMTDLQYERFTVFGEIPKKESTQLVARVADLRDNRDPVVVFAEINEELHALKASPILSDDMKTVKATLVNAHDIVIAEAAHR